MAQATTKTLTMNAKELEFKCKELSNSINTATNSGLDCSAWIKKLVIDYHQSKLTVPSDVKIVADKYREIIAMYFNGLDHSHSEVVEAIRETEKYVASLNDKSHLEQQGVAKLNVTSIDKHKPEIHIDMPEQQGEEKKTLYDHPSYPNLGVTKP